MWTIQNVMNKWMYHCCLDFHKICCSWCHHYRSSLVRNMWWVLFIFEKCYFNRNFFNANYLIQWKCLPLLCGFAGSSSQPSLSLLFLLTFRNKHKTNLFHCKKFTETKAIKINKLYLPVFAGFESFHSLLLLLFTYFLVLAVNGFVAGTYIQKNQRIWTKIEVYTPKKPNIYCKWRINTYFFVPFISHV